MRRAAKRDIAEPGIVEALEKAGCQVWRELPVDLLIHRPAWGKGWFRCAEVKTPGMNDHKKERKKQVEFIAETGCPIVETPLQALAAVTLR